MDGPPPSSGWSPTNPRMGNHQKEVHYRLWFWHLYITHETNTRWQLPWMFTQQNLGWSPIRRKCTTDLEFGNYTLFTKLTSGDKCHGWSPTFPGRFTCQPRDGHPPTKGWSPLLALLGPVWHHLAQVVHVWPHLASFGPVWPHERSSIFRHCACLHTWLC